MAEVFLLALAITLPVLLFWHYRRPLRLLPPSPPTLPLLGNTHLLTRHGDGTLLSSLTELAQTYGPVMTVWMGLNPVVVVSGHRALWEGLVTRSSSFAGRPPVPYIRFVSADFKTIPTMSSDNNLWIMFRKLLHRDALSVPNLLCCSSSHQRCVSALIRKLCKPLRWGEVAGVVAPFRDVKMMSCAFLCRIVLGSDMDEQEVENFVPKIADLVEREIEELVKRPRVIDLALRSPRLFNKSLTTLEADVLELFQPLLQRGRDDSKSFAQSFLGTLLSARDTGELNVSNKEIIFNLFDIFVLGVDSTSTAIEWALAYLITYPGLQQKAYAEIQEATINKDVVGFEDLPKLPYVQAVVKEVLRKQSIAPLALPHTALEDSEIMGYRIPAGTQILFNLHSAANDPEVWEKADDFIPERFMKKTDRDKDKQESIRMGYVPFGAGRRQCAGMELANLHVPVTLANLLKAFEWKSCYEQGKKSPDLTAHVPRLLRAMKYPLRARIRRRSTPRGQSQQNAEDPKVSFLTEDNNQKDLLTETV